MYPFSNDENLLFLYDRYYYGNEKSDFIKDKDKSNIDHEKGITFYTKIESPFERNRINVWALREQEKVST